MNINRSLTALVIITNNTGIVMRRVKVKLEHIAKLGFIDALPSPLWPDGMQITGFYITVRIGDGITIRTNERCHGEPYDWDDGVARAVEAIAAMAMMEG